MTCCKQRNICGNRPSCHDAVRIKCSENLVRNSWCPLHENPPALRTLVAKKHPYTQNVTALRHAPHSSDSPPAEYFLFSRLKCVLKGQRFASVQIFTTIHDESTDKVVEGSFLGRFRNLYQIGKSDSYQMDYFR
jgi:hypothetical protein